MKVIVDKDRCFGCTACTTIAPDIFTMDDDGLAKVINPEEDGFMNVESSLEEMAQSAVDSCPGSAIDAQ